MQLEEAVLGMALAVALAGTVLQLAVRSWRYSTEAAGFAQAAQQTQLLRQGWRRFIHECPERPLLSSASELSAGAWRATVIDETLLLQGAAEPRRLWLPPGMNAEMQREGAAGEAERWVLLVSWQGRRTGSHEGGRTRIVACRGEVAP
jgi:hypothetical protein